jgi:hypothetical protein
LGRSAYTVLVGKLEGKRHGHEWEDDIKMEMDCDRL